MKALLWGFRRLLLNAPAGMVVLDESTAWGSDIRNLIVQPQGLCQSSCNGLRPPDSLRGCPLQVSELPLGA